MSRLEKVNDLLRDEMSVLIKKSIGLRPGVFITVTKAAVSVDIKHAKIFISVLPEDQTDAVLKNLNSEIGGLQKQLNRKLVMRYVPKISFAVDYTASKLARMEEILKKSKL